MLTFELVWRFLVSLLNSGHLLLLGSQLGAQPALEAFGPAKKNDSYNGLYSANKNSALRLLTHPLVYSSVQNIHHC